MRTNRYPSLFAAAATLLLGCAVPSANATLIGGVTIENFSSELTVGVGAATRLAVDSINQTGLAGGVHNTAPADMWETQGTFSGGTDVPPWHITYDLEGNFALNAMRVWNFNEAGALSTAGAKDVEIRVSPTGNSADLVKLNNGAGDFVFTQAPGAAGYGGFNVNLAGVTNASLLNNVRLVRFDILTNHGQNNSLVGLSEVQFSAVTPNGPIAVPNFSFESPALGAGANNNGGAGNTTAITNWTIQSGSAGVFFPNGNGGLGNPLPGTANGSQYAYAESSDNAQVTSILLTGGLGAIELGAYTLTVALGHRNTSNRLPDNYRIELLGDGGVLGFAQLLDARNVIPAGSFSDLTFTFNTSLADLGKNLNIRLTHSTDDGVFRQGAFDNVRLSFVAFVPIPEPATATLGLMALGGLMMRRRRMA